MNTTPIIDVKNFNLYYGENHALHNINMHINEHEITALIGPSGCGKSTFLRSLNRMNDLIEGLRVDGSIKFKGTELVNTKINVSALRKDIGMVFQKPNPFAMSIYDNIAYGPRIHGIRNKSALDELVEKSLKKAAIFDEVKDRLKTSALGLSGGQQQRVAVARALASKPRFILADEPTANLDSATAADLLDIFAAFHQVGVTVVIATHDPQ